MSVKGYRTPNFLNAILLRVLLDQLPKKPCLDPLFTTFEFRFGNQLVKKVLESCLSGYHSPQKEVEKHAGPKWRFQIITACFLKVL